MVKSSNRTVERQIINDKPLKIVADAHIWGAQSAFSSLPGFAVDLHLMENAQITRKSVSDADILLTRSSTKVDAGLLEDTSVRFAATATIGDDHFDKMWLDEAGIVWANAAGSSTGSVIEYMISALLELHVSGLVHLPESTLGIIGVGRIGGELSRRASALGIKVLHNDPPRARVEGERVFDSLDNLLLKSDLLTLHTPLIREGVDQTRHLINAETLARFRGRGVINSARGGCVDNEALADWLDEDSQRFAVLDCWEGEPAVSNRLLGHAQVVIATPHIAGHSLDGKAANTQFVYGALCRYLEIEPVWQMDHELPECEPMMLEVDGSEFKRLQTLASSLYPIMRDHQMMRQWQGLDSTRLVEAFTHFRRSYPVRRGWNRVPIQVEGDVSDNVKSLAHSIGIHLLGLPL